MENLILGWKGLWLTHGKWWRAKNFHAHIKGCKFTDLHKLSIKLLKRIDNYDFSNLSLFIPIKPGNDIIDDILPFKKDILLNHRQTASLQNESCTNHPEWVEVMNIVFGLCNYINSIEKNSIFVIKKNASLFSTLLPHSFSGRCMMSSSELFEIAHNFKLTTKNARLFMKQKLNVGFRRTCRWYLFLVIIDVLLVKDVSAKLRVLYGCVHI